MCRFFLKGNCLKGEHCKFFHDENMKASRETTPECRNGASCTYLLRGLCRFIMELTEVKLHNLEHHIEIKVTTNQTDGAYF